MSDEQLEQDIEAITAMLAARDAGTNAKVIEGVAEPVPGPPKTARKTDGDMVTSMGKDDGADERGCILRVGARASPRL